jgi:hypothetical protein
MRIAITVCVLRALLLPAGCHDGLHDGVGGGCYAHTGGHAGRRGRHQYWRKHHDRPRTGRRGGHST